MKSIQRVPVVQQVADNLRDYILSGKVEAGAKLPSEKELCAQMSVGRGTVREAFRILQTTGLVEIKPGRGAFVARTSIPEPDDIVEWFVKNEVELKDCIEIRTAIEPLAVRLLIQNASDADIAYLTRVHEKFLAAVERHDAAAIAKYDDKFHGNIMKKSGNKLIYSISTKISECIEGFRGRTFMVDQNIKNAIAPHTNIMNAIRERDSEAGEMFMRRHLEQVLIDLVEMTNTTK